MVQYWILDKKIGVIYCGDSFCQNLGKTFVCKGAKSISKEAMQASLLFPVS